MARITPSSAGSSSGASGTGLPATFQAKTATYTALAGEFVRCDTSGGGFTVTLPSNPPAGTLVTVKKVDNSANTLTIAPSGSGTIDGDANATTNTKGGGAVFEHVASDVWQVAAVTIASGPAGSTGSTGATGGTGPPGPAGSPPVFFPAVGEYMAPLFAAANGFNNPAVGTLNAVPIVLPSCTLDQIALGIQTATATALVRLGLYSADANGHISSLIVDAGTIDGSTTGVKTRTINQTVTAGIYYVAAVAQTAAPYVWTHGNAAPVIQLVSAATNNMNVTIYDHYTTTGVTGALPDAPTWSLAQGAAPRIYVRRSA